MLPFYLLLSKLKDNFGNHVGHGGCDGMGSAALCDLCDGKAVGDDSDFRPAEFDRNIHSHQSQLGHFLQIFIRELLLFIHSCGYGFDVLLRKIPCHISDHSLARGSV